MDLRKAPEAYGVDRRGQQGKMPGHIIHRKPTGQGMVEFALLLPLLLTLVWGVFEAGRMLFVISAVTTASREASRYGSAIGDNGSGTPRYQDCDGIRAAAKALGGFAGIEDGDIVIQYDDGPGTSSTSSCPPSSVDLGDRIVVQVTSTFDPLVPLVELPTFPITSTSRRTLLVEVETEQ